MPANNTITIALIGCGLWGPNILRDLTELDCRVIVVDPDQSQRAKAESLGAFQTLERIEALPEVDGFVVATPATTHAEVLGQVLDRNSPVFCEKPLTTDPTDAHNLSLQARGKLFVMHIWRYHPAVQELASIVATGELGQIQMLRTTRTNWTSPRTDTDSIWTLVPHDLTIALAVLAKIPEPRSSA